MIINKTKRIIISKRYKLCKTTLSKALGLMFSINPKTLLLSWKQEKKRGIHMFFVFFPIDLIYLNKEKKVIAIKENLKPFSIYNMAKPTQYIIELPKGKIKRTKTKLKDIIEF